MFSSHDTRGHNNEEQDQENTELVSQIENIEFTGMTDCDPDSYPKVVSDLMKKTGESDTGSMQDTGIDSPNASRSLSSGHSSQKGSQPLEVSSSKVNKSDELDPDSTFFDEAGLGANLSTTGSQEHQLLETGEKDLQNTQVLSEKNHFQDLSLDINDKPQALSVDTEKPVEVTMCLNPSQDEQYYTQDEENPRLTSENTSDKRKCCNSTELQGDQTSLKSASSLEISSFNSSQSTSSLSKRATESDDLEDNIQASQDMFASQGTACSQNSTLTVSQLVPTFQLSGDLISSQENDHYLPRRLLPCSPGPDLDTNHKGTTSTPLRHIKKPKTAEEQEIHSNSFVKSSEKRKHSDSSGENDSSTYRAKKLCDDNRRSVVLVGEFLSSKKTAPQKDFESFTQDSQAFVLQLSQSDPEVPYSQQSTEVSSSLMEENSWKSHLESINEAEDTLPLEKTSEQQDISIVNIDDGEDDILVVSPPASKLKAAVLGEITLDSSGPLQALSASGEPDIEVLSPPGLTAKPASEMKSSNQKSVVKEIETNHDIDSSKENIQPDQLFEEKHFYLNFSGVVRVSCRADLDTNTKEVIKNSLLKAEVIDLKSSVRWDVSPSRVEENSSGSPSSNVSGPGPFPLQPTHLSRLTMCSTTSSSSAGSLANQTYRKAMRRNNRPLMPQSPTTHSQDVPIKQQGSVPWEDLISSRQFGEQLNEVLPMLQESALSSLAPRIAEWASSLHENCSSDENKTIMKTGSDTLVDDDNEDIHGFPLTKGRKLVAKIDSREKSDSASSGGSTSTVLQTIKTDDTKVDDHESKDSSSISKEKKGRPARPRSKATPRKREKATQNVKSPKVKKSFTGDSVEHPIAPDDSANSNNSNDVVPGCQVFAYWHNFYYPAKLLSRARPNQWNVIFHDSTEKALSDKFICLVSIFEIGQSVWAKPENAEDYCPGEVIAVTPSSHEEDDLYTIKLAASGDIVKVPRSELALSEELTKSFPLLSELVVSSNSTSSTPSKCTSGSKTRKNYVDLDNVIEGKRFRTPKGNEDSVNSPSRPGPSRTFRRLISDSSSAVDDGPLASAIILGVHPEQSDWASNADPLARKGRGVKGSASKKPLPDIDDEKIVSKLGPLPPTGSKIFTGYSFFVTATDVLPKHRGITLNKSSSDLDSEANDKDIEHGSDCECFKFARKPIVKGRLKRQIIQGGGRVLSHWADISAKDIKHTYVITNRPCLTAIYIHCIARNIKSVNHEHIINCCIENKRFGNDLQRSLLPVGFSLLSGFIEWSGHKSKSPLKGETILVSGDKNFVAFWEEILRLSGALPFSFKKSDEKTSDLATVTKILSENPCPDSILQLSKTWKLPIVSPVWITQSLINNKVLSVSDDASFAFDYNSESES